MSPDAALYGDTAAKTTSEPMGRLRTWLVIAIILAIVAGSLFDMVTGRRHWPFSPYAMYSEARRERSLSLLRLYGVTNEAGRRELPLVTPQYTQPFSRAQLVGAFRSMMSTQREACLREALQDCLERYEALRRSGGHDGPPLDGIRLYRVSWSLDPWARNVDRPDQKQLIAEVRRQ